MSTIPVVRGAKADATVAPAIACVNTVGTTCHRIGTPFIRDRRAGRGRSKCGVSDGDLPRVIRVVLRDPVQQNYTE